MIKGAMFLLAIMFSAPALASEKIVWLSEEHVDRDCVVPCARTAVVFIHGITGSQTTWGDPSGHYYWPKMLSVEPDLYSALDIYRVDYTSNYGSGPAAVRIKAALEKELDAIMIKKRYTKVIFIAHSLGGLITKAYLTHVKNRFGHPALSRFRMVITLGTPNEGADLANIAWLGTQNEHMRVLRTIDVNDFVQLLGSIARDFREKHEDCPTLRTFAAYEKEAAYGLRIVVNQVSATKDAYATEGFEKDHLELSKPQSRSDRVYRWATDAVRGCVQNDGYYCPALQPGPGQCAGRDFPK